MLPEMQDTLADWKQEIFSIAKENTKKKTYQGLIDSLKKIQEGNSFTGSLRKTIIYSLCDELIKELSFQARKQEYKEAR
ncbi:hypothetical protein [Liquorilactobacillus nagelii]|uniref:hypothetical protein n=1 Tax=Liquorilactobacillus nagelii TaxID=82688 RepID=UPI001CCD8AAE|nr:hypothetical protein [Liquorilactobacillus nagelii]ULQ49028.1 hypothetical protein J6864_08670 [Liquorilactobacillus nagelii]